jgi:hypothetical protein
MKNFVSIFTVVAACLWLVTPQVLSGQTDPLGSSTEVMVVTTAGWNAVEGTLQAYERANPPQKWHAVGAPVTVVVGKSGLGWGSGVWPTPNADRLRSASDPVKKEGDGKAPAGIFALNEGFGYAPQEKPGSKMPYMPLTPSIECVDDTNSKFYNRILDRAAATPDWHSSEQMLRSDELYRWGIVVEHNSNPPRPGGGSCIFLHIWRGPGQGTVGCTAMPQEQLEKILAWLDPRHKPLLIQLPETEYRKLQKRLKLPERSETKGTK